MKFSLVNHNVIPIQYIPFARATTFLMYTFCSVMCDGKTTVIFKRHDNYDDFEQPPMDRAISPGKCSRTVMSYIAKGSRAIIIIIFMSVVLLMF